MVRYFFGWIPLFIVGSIALLAAPWLGVIALLVLSLVALAAVAFAVVVLPYLLVREISRGVQSLIAARPHAAPALSRVTHLQG